MKKLFPLLTLIGLLTFSSCKPEEPIEPKVETTLIGTLTENKTLTADKIWVLKGYVYVPEDITLIIEPGTTIKSDIEEKGALCIERGGRIIAEGSVDRPIVFTSGQPTPRPGDWGGIIILGKATTNKVEPTIEGGVGRPYGGNDDNDNSGVLRYVRVEYAGVAAFPNSEINAFTFGGVGSNTVIEYCEAYYANDDAFEFFGGTVSPKYLLAVGTADDDFDFDFGYRGTVQYAISKRDPKFVDGADAGNGIECDNDGTGSNATPVTKPILLNFTLVGPSDTTALPNHNLAMRWRRATNFSVQNSIFFGYLKGGFSIESDATATSYKTGESVFINNYVSSISTNNLVVSKSTMLTSTEMKTLCESNGVVLSTSQTAPFDNMFQTNSSMVNGQWGAIPSGSSNWLLGWTKF